ncbi:Tox-REase-5 domain-containing protein [Archangium sp.]|uniref:Tox-REase-5 domain-containing protein n=1 Tax=Archangium sp. TaxID=1872627 RepID=UPI00286B155F|nr:Tox-REase-5 domain-containing protein [Archangium sp.]
MGLLALAVLALLAGCATGVPGRGGGHLLTGMRPSSPTPRFLRQKAPEAVAGAPQASALHPPSTREEDDEPEDDSDEEERAATEVTEAFETPSRTRPGPAWAEGEEELEERGEGGVGWRDGVGDGRPRTVPMRLDYFQGLLAYVGVPAEALPVDGRTLSPEQAVGLLPHLLSTEVELGDFAQRRMAAHLLLEVATGAGPVRREELHARMDRFHRLVVLRPDGYLALAVTGEAKQKTGEVRVAEDGTLRAGRYEVGPFYAIEDGRLWPVDEALAVVRGAGPLGPYVPDDGVVLPALEGAGLALVDTVEGLYRLVFHTGETLEGLTRLPGAVRQLVHNAPEYWEAFRRKPYGERLRTVSRLTTHVVLMVGSGGAGAGTGAAKAGRLGQLAFPLFSLTREGALAMRVVVVPGKVVTAAGGLLNATYVLSVATTGAVAASGGGPPAAWTPPVGGPGQWVPKNERMSPRSRQYQHKVTKAPGGWVYRVFRNGEKADFDGFEAGVLRETKGLGYAKHFDMNLRPKRYFKGAERLVEQAQRQARVSNGNPIRWHVAEPRMVDILRRLFRLADVKGVDVVHTPP